MRGSVWRGLLCAAVSCLALGCSERPQQAENETDRELAALEERARGLREGLAGTSRPELRAEFAGGDSASSNESCATTDTFYQVACTGDVSDARGHLVNILTSPDPDYTQWRTRVGLSNVDPNGLVVINSDTICTTLWNVAFTRPPFPGSLVTFFHLDDFYIVTEYPGPTVTGRGLTIVVNTEFEGQGPVLAE